MVPKKTGRRNFYRLILGLIFEKKSFSGEILPKQPDSES